MKNTKTPAKPQQKSYFGNDEEDFTMENDPYQASNSKLYNPQ
jgi:hypothetical protein